MKNVLISIVVVIIVILGGYYMYIQSSSTRVEDRGMEDNMVPEHNGSVPKEGTYGVIQEESKVHWTAGKPLIAGYTHRGVINVESGTIVIGENEASGSFVIDMTSVKVTSLGGGKEGRESQLESHLKTGDFFDVETYPTAGFSIVKVTPSDVENIYTIDGSLTMKGVTNDVSYPAQIYEEDGKLHALADFTIDRTKWNITFGSSNFFDNLANNAIGDDVTLSLDIVATTQVTEELN